MTNMPTVSSVDGNPKLLPFTLGLFIGLAVGFLIAYSRHGLENHHSDYVVDSDYNNDKIVDSRAFYVSGCLQRIESDRNSDGKPDQWDFFEREILVRTEQDDDFDGKPDVWNTFKNSVLQFSAMDTDKNGIPDRFDYFKWGTISMSTWRVNESTQVSRFEIFNGVTKTREYYGLNCAGSFTNIAFYDVFGNRTSTEVLKEPIAPQQILQDVLAAQHR